MPSWSLFCENQSSVLSRFWSLESISVFVLPLTEDCRLQKSGSHCSFALAPGFTFPPSWGREPGHWRSSEMWRDCRTQEVPCFPVKIRFPGEHVWLSGSDKGGKSKSSFHREQPFPGRRVGKSEWWSKVEPWIDTARVCRNEISQLLSYLTQILGKRRNIFKGACALRRVRPWLRNRTQDLAFCISVWRPHMAGATDPGSASPRRSQPQLPRRRLLFSPPRFTGVWLTEHWISWSFTTWWFGIHIYFEMITRGLVNTSITSHGYHFSFFAEKTFKIYS